MLAANAHDEYDRPQAWDQEPDRQEQLGSDGHERQDDHRLGRAPTRRHRERAVAAERVRKHLPRQKRGVQLGEAGEQVHDADLHLEEQRPLWNSVAAAASKRVDGECRVGPRDREQPGGQRQQVVMVGIELLIATRITPGSAKRASTDAVVMPFSIAATPRTMRMTPAGELTCPPRRAAATSRTRGTAPGHGAQPSASARSVARFEAGG